ncbi:MAG: GNAT family N-acetyltransferase [Desulfuromonadaceae bacterium]|nr:GNAT family N-acetyltransferase [Desulfuromonadaceae bacterium]
MTIEPFCTEEIPAFLALAEAEQWVAESWEFEFLLSAFPQGCFTARGSDGEAVGFVTSLHHRLSGWIGNLIVAGEQRGKRIGQRLFGAALEALRGAGAETYWLTASKSGQPLYEKYGFTRTDTIIRWIGKGRQKHGGLNDFGSGTLNAPAIDLDRLSWGDQRDMLLAATVGRGNVLQDESGFISLQPCGDSVQIGPFAAGSVKCAEHLFEDAIRTVALGTKIVLDAPVSNRAALRIFNHGKMRIAGSTELMYAGRKPDYRPELVYGLATMGSCG